MVVQDQMELEQPEQHEVMEQLRFRVRIVMEITASTTADTDMTLEQVTLDFTVSRTEI